MDEARIANFVVADDHAVGRIGEVDRTESIEAVYDCVLSGDGCGLSLEVRRLDPPIIAEWTSDGLRERMDKWTTEVADGGVMFVAEETSRMAAFAILGGPKIDGSAELVALFVDAKRRGQGLGSKLFDMAEEYSFDQGFSAMTIHSNPTVATVDFYLHRGAVVIGMLDRRLITHLSGDIILAKPLR